MATKGDQIRNLVKTLGGEPRNSTVEDAIEDLVCLFEEKREVEMVEIVPEQSVTGEYNTQSGMNLAIIQKNETQVEYGVEYVVIFNDERYKVESLFDDSVYLHFENNNEKHIEVAFDAETKVFWPTDYGETITIAIYEEKVIVTPPVASVAKKPDMVITLDGCGLDQSITTDVVTITSGTVSDVIEKMVKGIPVDVRVRGFVNSDEGYYVESEEVKANVIFYGGVLHINYFCFRMTGQYIVTKHIAINEGGNILEVRNRSITTKES